MPYGFLALPVASLGMLGVLYKFADQYGVGYGKILTSWLIINLSMVLQTLLSIIVYRQAITLRRVIGLLLAIATLFLWREQVQEEATGKFRCVCALL